MIAALALLAISTPFEAQVARGAGKPVVVLAPRPSATVAAVRVDFLTGSADDGGREGLTRLTQLAMLASDDAFLRLSADVFAAGGSLRVDTEHQRAGFVLRAPAGELEGLAGRFLGLLLAPKLREAGLARARSLASQPPTLENLDVFVSYLARAAISDEGYAADPAGRAAVIKEIEPSELSAQRARYFTPANATVVVTGRFDARRMRAMLSGYGGGTRRKLPKPKGELFGDYSLKAPIELHLLAYPVTLDGARAAAAAELAASIAGERVLREFRRRGVGYAASAEIVTRPWLDFLLVVLPIRSEPGSSVGALLTEELERVGTEPWGEALVDARAHVLSKLAATDRDPYALAELLAAYGGPPPWAAELEDAIRTIDEAEAKRALGATLSRARAIHVQAGPTGGRRG